MQRVSVLLPTTLTTYDYNSNLPVQLGDFVHVPFGGHTRLGVLWYAHPDLTLSPDKIKQIADKADILPLPAKLCAFIQWVADYTLAPVGSVLKMALPPEVEKKSRSPKKFEVPAPRFTQMQFSPEQQQAVGQLLPLLDKGFQPILLDGITGSGKTEVYFEAVAKALTQKKQVLVLLPEIALTSAFLDRFKKRFGAAPAVWHSSVTPKVKRDTWQGVRQGTISVVVGARSALFLPFTDLGLVVVDEEHDSSFKQEEGILYNARDMAVVRAKIESCPVILSSATPSLETYCNAVQRKYVHIVLNNRFYGAPLPDVTLVDMRYKGKSKQEFISPTLQKALQEVLSAHEQALLFINRRGYAPLVMCHACGHKFKCPHCNVYLTQHKKAGRMVCHYCGYNSIIPAACPHCHEKDGLFAYGVGAERVLEEAQKLFPSAHIALISSDTIAQKDKFQEFVQQMNTGAVDIVIGTQLLAKGHNFLNLTLVGVIDADMTLQSGDLRASERTFQLLNQVTGRAGRAAKTGKAFLQTYAPDNLVIKALQSNCRDTFLQTEMQTRSLLQMPPFGKLASILITGKNNLKTQEVAQQMMQKAPVIQGTDILGPMAAPLSKLKNKYRWRILIKAPKSVNVQALVRVWLQKIACPPSVSIKVDIDPYNFN